MFPSLTNYEGIDFNKEFLFLTILCYMIYSTAFSKLLKYFGQCNNNYFIIEIDFKAEPSTTSSKIIP